MSLLKSIPPRAIPLDAGPSGGTCRIRAQSHGAATPIEKAGDFAQFVRRSVTRQGLQENFTIGHALEAGIQERQNAAIRLCSNQAAKALFEGQDRLRYLKFRKGVAPVVL